jgi:hypothetical protein
MNNFNYVLKKKQKAKNTEHRMVSTIISKKGDCPVYHIMFLITVIEFGLDLTQLQKPVQELKIVRL